MPRYFFNRMDGHNDSDADGSEHPDFAAAREAAIVFLAETIKARPCMLNDTGEFKVELTDERGLLLTTVVVHAINAPAIVVGQPSLPRG